MSWRRLHNVLKSSWICLEDDFARHLEDVWPRRIYWSWPRRLEDVFWRRMTKANIFVVIKTSSEDEDKRRLQDLFNVSSSRQMFAGTSQKETQLNFIQCKMKEKINVDLDWSIFDKANSYSPASKNACYVLQGNITSVSLQRIYWINAMNWQLSVDMRRNLYLPIFQIAKTYHHNCLFKIFFPKWL